MLKLFSNNYLNFPKVQYKVFGIKFKRYFEPKHYDKVNVFFHESEGIGNRILGLMNCINFLTPKELNIFWDTKFHVTAKFSDLFDYDSDVLLNEHNDLFDYSKKMKNRRYLSINIPCVELQTLDGIGLELKYNDISKDILEKYSKEFQKLRPSKRVQERLQSINLPDNFVALQVRNNNDWLKYGRNESLELFFEKMDSFPNDTVFYLSAMNKETTSVFKEQYGERILQLPDKDYSSMIDAVAEMYILSKAKRAIYSYGSTFSEVAFWLNKGEQQVQIIGNKNNWYKLKDGKPIKRKNNAKSSSICSL